MTEKSAKMGKINIEPLMSERIVSFASTQPVNSNKNPSLEIDNSLCTHILHILFRNTHRNLHNAVKLRV